MFLSHPFSPLYLQPSKYLTSSKNLFFYFFQLIILSYRIIRIFIYIITFWWIPTINFGHWRYYRSLLLLILFTSFRLASKHTKTLSHLSYSGVHCLVWLRLLDFLYVNTWCFTVFRSNFNKWITFFGFCTIIATVCLYCLLMILLSYNRSLLR